ncbi:MAG: DUF58 domain-containing protein [Candidatus Sericytochromatia bacterium]
MKFRLIPAPQSYVILFITIALFLAATNVQGGWLYIIDSLLLSLLIFAIISPINQTRRVNIYREFNNTLQEGEKNTIEIVIDNTKGKIASFIEIKDSELLRLNDNKTIIKALKKGHFFIEIESGEKSTFKYELNIDLRGIYKFKGFDITSYGPFGLFKFSRTIKNENELIVQPVLPIINKIFFDGLKGAGFRYSSKTTHNTNASLPVSVRDYRRGDSRKLIHWKSTARNNRLMVKELENEQSLSIQILLDTENGNSIGLGKENNLEYLIKFAGAILRLCIEKNYKVDLIYHSNNSLIRLTEDTTIRQIMDSLAYIKTDSKIKLRDLLNEKEIDSNSIIIPLFLKVNEKDIEKINKMYQDRYSVFPVFTDTNSFDKNYFPIEDIINKSLFKYMIIKKGESF